MTTTVEFFDDTNVDGGIEFGNDLRLATVHEYERVLAEESGSQKVRMEQLTKEQAMREFFSRVWERGEYSFSD